MVRAQYAKEQLFIPRMLGNLLEPLSMERKMKERISRMSCLKIFTFMGLAKGSIFY